MFPQSKLILVVLAFLLHNSLLYSQGNIDCPSPTFFKTFGDEFQSEYATTIIRSSDNNLILAGREGGRTFIQKMNTSGVVLWTHTFQTGPFESVTPSEIIEDSEGMIVGCGTQGVAGLSKGFVFRYDPVNNVMLWARAITSNNPTAAGILEKGPGGNFLFYQYSFLISGERDAEIIEINRVSGALNPSLARRYEYISSDIFTKMIYANGALYATGSSLGRFGDINITESRQLLARIDSNNLNPVWAQLSHRDTLAPISFVGRDLVLDGDSLVSVYVGKNPLSFDNTGNDTIYLQKTDFDGNIRWVRSYNILAGVMKLIVVPDGYVIFGQQDVGPHIVLKTDKNGVPLWGRRLTENLPGGAFTNLIPPNQAVAIADSLYFSGISSNGNSDIFLWKLLSDGSMADSCGFVDTLALESTLIVEPVRTVITMNQVFSTATDAVVTPALQDAEFLLTQFCPDCSVPDPCPEHNDFVVSINDVYCEAGKINMQFTFCDLNGDTIPPLTVSFFNANPYTQNAVLLGTYNYSPLTTDSCWAVELTDLETKFGAANIANGAHIFAAVNVPGNAETPFVLNDFPLTDLAECDYSNNTDDFTLQFPASETLDLGPDKTVCPNLGAVLTANGGFFKYQWSTGPTTQSITATFSGQYRVTVTDFCGFKQTDTIEVIVLPIPQVSETGSFCPGKSVSIRGFQFDQPGIFQRTLTGANADCDTTATFFITELPYQNRNEIVRFCPGETVTINGVTYDESGLAKDTLAGTIGCDTIIFYFLNQLPAPFRFDTAYICPGDSVKVGDYYYSEPGLVFDTLPSLTPIGCDTVIRVQVYLLPQPTVSQTIQFCPGTSVEVQGQEYTQPGELSFILPAISGGCDTLLEITLEWLPAPSRSDTVKFCQGTSVEIDGNSYTEPGTVLSTIPGVAGECDTLLTYILEWIPGPTASQAIAFCPGTSVEIGGNIYTEPGTVTATSPGSGGGCDTLVTYTLTWLPAPTSTDTLRFCEGSSIVIDGTEYTQPGTVLSTIPGTGGGCDTVLTHILEWLPAPTRTETIQFCPGKSVEIDGITYTESDTITSIIPANGVGCDTVVTYFLELLPENVSLEFFSFCPGGSITLNGVVYTQAGTYVDTIPYPNGPGCDVIATYVLTYSDLPTSSRTLEFCEGASITLGGQTYTQPATVVITEPGAPGACDTLVTYTLQYLDPLPSAITAHCPFNVNVITTPGTGSIPVNYNQPTATSDCTCPGISWTLSAGLASGSLFPPGKTNVCYIAKDSCGSTDDCCFDVIVREEAPCDTKVIGCMRYDILSITADAQQRYTYKIRVTNSCTGKLSYTAIELPDAVVAVSPTTNSVYESPEGYDYLVRNPNYTPFYSIRFKTLSDSIANGQSAILEYTLPAQSHPTFIHITSRLEPQVYYEAHLNTFNCFVGVTKPANRSDSEEIATMVHAEKTMLLFPNPTSGELFADLSDWQGSSLEIRVLDSRGQRVQTNSVVVGNAPESIRLPESLPNGLYFLEILTEQGEKQTGRFVIAR